MGADTDADLDLGMAVPTDRAVGDVTGDHRAADEDSELGLVTLVPRRV
jgi:hypothetical protein